MHLGLMYQFLMSLQVANFAHALITLAIPKAHLQMVPPLGVHAHAGMPCMYNFPHTLILILSIL